MTRGEVPAASDDDERPQMDGQWHALFNEVRRLGAAHEQRALFHCLAPEGRRLPFREVLLPFLQAAWERIGRSAGHGLALLEPEPVAALQYGLLERLSTAATPSLYLEFSLRRRRAATGLELLVQEVLEPGTNGIYRRFVGELLSPDALFWDLYPELSRRLSLMTLGWIGSTTAFLDRLHRDQALIAATFGRSHGPLVTALEPGLSDPHDGGSQVISVSFGNDLVLFYKPRPVAAECSFSAFLQWVNGQAPLRQMQAQKILDRRTYGWVAQIRHEPCRNAGEVEGFYLRLGQLVCILYALRGVDCHAGNLIASGPHPVQIDAETLLHPEGHGGTWQEGEHALALARSFLKSSIFSTGILPQWSGEEGEQTAFDVSALGASVPQRVPYRRPRWENANSDAMRPVWEAVTIEAQPNGPSLGGERVDPSAYVPELIRGFEAMHRLLSARRDLLLDPAGPLAELFRQPVRYIHRRTDSYAQLLEWTHSPDLSRVDPSDLLASKLTSGAKARGGADDSAVIADEVAALRRGDIPVFYYSADTVDLTGRDLRIAGFFRKGGVEAVRERITAFGREDMEKQVALLRVSLLSHQPNRPEPRSASRSRKPSRTCKNVGKGARAAFLAAAEGIADDLVARSFRSDLDGSIAWLSPRYLPSRNRYCVEAMGHDLYSGSIGIALFFAACAKLLDRSDLAAVSRGLVGPLRHAIDADAGALVKQLGIGGGVGMGSIVYGLVSLASLLEDSYLPRLATRAADAIAPEPLSPPAPWDLLGGGGGAVLALLRLHEATAEPRILEKAVRLGESLLRRRTGSSWSAHDGTRLTGFSHGAAGMAYAFFSLFAASGNEAFRAAAIAAVDYENSTFDAAAGNWPDLREGLPGAFAAAWCHGAPGIALARAGALAEHDTPRMRRDIASGLAVIARRTEGELPVFDHLCCGTMGLAEIELTVAQVLGDAERVRSARSTGLECIRRSRERGGATFDVVGDAGFINPGFFSGLSGVGYAYLRLAAPEDLPAILLWR